jgi:hypothetical protein
MIKKKGRGGARKGAGRKRVIQENDRTWIEIGIACEYLQKEVPEKRAREAIEKRSVTKKIRKFQALVVERKADARQRDLIWERVFKNSRPSDWAVSLPRHRVATREQIIAIISDGYMKKGRLRITPGRVRECWKRYRRLLKLEGANPTEEPSEAELIAQQTPG